MTVQPDFGERTRRIAEEKLEREIIWGHRPYGTESKGTTIESIVAFGPLVAHARPVVGPCERTFTFMYLGTIRAINRFFKT